MSKLYKRGDVFYLRYRVHGRFKWKSLRTKNRREAAQRRKTFDALTETPSILDDETRPTVSTIAADYLEYAQSYYRRADGTPTQSIHKVRSSINTLCAQYGDADATELGPRRLKKLREDWIAAGLARHTVNDYTDEVRRMFKWAVSEELIPVTVYQALITVRGLRAGESGVRETEPKKPPPAKAIKAVRAIVPPQLRALIDLQIVTGARPGELCLLRPCDIDTTDTPWVGVTP